MREGDPTTASLSERAEELAKCVTAARAAVNDTILGQERVVDELMLAMLAGGHVLLEGAPGLGKTLLVRTLARVCHLEFSRIQFTPDLMPADITGSNVLTYDEQGRGRTDFAPGPVFGQLVLADEINRATPKTQSALLEAMQEQTVTAGGEEHALPSPFFVMATQNPIEMEGTYALPEAQLDRFLVKSVIDYPDDVAMLRIVRQGPPMGVEGILHPHGLVELQSLVRAIHVPDVVAGTVVRFARSSQPQLNEATDSVRRFLRFGISPRGAQYLVLASQARALLEGRFNASLEDLKHVATAVLRHRLQRTFTGVAEGADVDALLHELLDASMPA